MVSLPRALEPGDEVILSTGAVAVVRKSYPKGYRGQVEFELDGRLESDDVGSLTLQDAAQPQDAAALGTSDRDDREGEESNVRAPSTRMED
ncbi:MAG TPA: hypothetical protein VFE16_03710 [Candidatus Cybelea sp.]|jgi:hypothetical protein|nr:hypothetical protein [Candidatus Cybelea sp.]